MNRLERSREGRGLEMRYLNERAREREREKEREREREREREGEREKEISKYETSIFSESISKHS